MFTLFATDTKSGRVSISILIAESSAVHNICRCVAVALIFIVTVSRISVGICTDVHNSYSIA